MINEEVHVSQSDSRIGIDYAKHFSKTLLLSSSFSTLNSEACL